MSKLTFSIGGIHPADSKLARDCRIEVLPLPPKVYVSMFQHLGAQAKPIVAVGDKVKAGQIIAEPGGFISAYVHSPVSGTVKAIGPRKDLAGFLVMHIEIDVEGDEWAEGIDLSPELVATIPEDREFILDRIKMIRGAGGGFTFVRNISERQRTLLAEWDIEPDDFKGIVSDYNERMQSKMVSQNRRKPEHDEAAGGRRKPGRRKKASATDQPDNEGKPKRKRGRPKGSGRKAPEKQPKKTGRKPGRPKGAKNKKTLAKEAAMAAAGITPVKRPKGRPKGSKDSKPRKKAKRGKSVSEGLEK